MVHHGGQCPDTTQNGLVGDVPHRRRRKAGLPSPPVHEEAGAGHPHDEYARRTAGVQRPPLPKSPNRRTLRAECGPQIFVGKGRKRLGHV